MTATTGIPLKSYIPAHGSGGGHLLYPRTSAPVYCEEEALHLPERKPSRSQGMFLIELTPLTTRSSSNELD